MRRLGQRWGKAEGVWDGHVVLLGRPDNSSSIRRGRYQMSLVARELAVRTNQLRGIRCIRQLHPLLVPGRSTHSRAQAPAPRTASERRRCSRTRAPHVYSARSSATSSNRVCRACVPALSVATGTLRLPHGVSIDWRTRIRPCLPGCAPTRQRCGMPACSRTRTKPKTRTGLRRRPMGTVVAAAATTTVMALATARRMATTIRFGMQPHPLAHRTDAHIPVVLRATLTAAARRNLLLFRQTTILLTHSQGEAFWLQSMAESATMSMA